MLTLRYIYLNDEIAVDNKLKIMGALHPGYIYDDIEQLFRKSSENIMKEIKRKMGKDIKVTYLSAIFLVRYYKYAKTNDLLQDYLLSLTTDQLSKNIIILLVEFLQKCRTSNLFVEVKSIAGNIGAKSIYGS